MKSTRTQAALFGRSETGSALENVYGPQRIEHLGQVTDLYPTVITSQNIEEHLPKLTDVEAIFSTWGMFSVTPAQIERLPNLKAVFYAAGSVRYFAAPFIERGITVVSAWAANAVPVAEFTLAQILLANKGYFRNLREYRDAASFSPAFRGIGNYDATVSLLGAGQIGRKLIELLRPFQLQLLVFDPFLSGESAKELNVEKVELADAFTRGDVVSNHLADLPETEGLLNGALFAALRPNATFINTGRGKTVNEEELVEVLRQRPDVTALLDVTHPEPCPGDSPLRELPGVYLTSHIAGSLGDEVGRMADYMIEEFTAWQEGRPLRYAVTQQMLSTMA